MAHTTTSNGSTGPAGEELRFLSPEEVHAIAETYGTPTYVYDEASMQANAQEMLGLPSAFGLDVRYSLKACPTAEVVKIFDRLGLIFDASSTWEAIRAIRAGVDPEKILLTAQEAPFDSQLTGLVLAGMKFDASSLRQLDHFGQHFPGKEVSVRINPGFGSGMVRRLTSGGPDSSFGIWVDQIPEIERIVKEHQLQVERFHMHIGSCHDPEVLLRALRVLLDMARTFESATIIDLGGGYQIKALLDDPEIDHSSWAIRVAQEMQDFAEETGRRLHLEAEPGTFLVANAGSIVSRVLDVVETGPDGRTFVKIDAGLTEILRPSYYGARHPLVTVPKGDREPHPFEEISVSGHCCIAGDVLTTVVGHVEQLGSALLRRPEPDDYLVVERAGGYCSSMAMKNFNSFPEAPEVLRRADGSTTLIRRRQTIEQLLQNELDLAPVLESGRVS